MVKSDKYIHMEKRDSMNFYNCILFGNRTENESINDILGILENFLIKCGGKSQKNRLCRDMYEFIVLIHDSLKKVHG